MRKSFLVFAVIALAACASSNNNLKVNIAQPSVVVEQLSSQPTVAEHVTGGIPIYLGVAVTNNADIPITLKRVSDYLTGPPRGCPAPSAADSIRDLPKP